MVLNFIKKTIYVLIIISIVIILLRSCYRFSTNHGSGVAICNHKKIPFDYINISKQQTIWYAEYKGKQMILPAYQCEIILN